MSALALEWLHQQVRGQLHLRSLENDMRNGFAFGVLLHALGHMSDECREELIDSREEAVMAKNFTLVASALVTLRLKLTRRVVGEIISGQRGAAAALVLQIKAAKTTDTTPQELQDRYFQKAIHSVRPANHSQVKERSTYPLSAHCLEALQSTDALNFKRIDDVVTLERFYYKQNHNEDVYNHQAARNQSEALQSSATRRTNKLNRDFEKRKFFAAWMEEGKKHWSDNMRRKYSSNLRDLQYENAVEVKADLYKEVRSLNRFNDFRDGLSKFEGHLGSLGLSAIQGDEEDLKPSYETKHTYIKRISSLVERECDLKERQEMMEQLKKRASALVSARQEKLRRRRKEMVEQRKDQIRVNRMEEEDAKLISLERKADYERRSAQKIHETRVQKIKTNQTTTEKSKQQWDSQAVRIEQSVKEYCNKISAQNSFKEARERQAELLNSHREEKRAVKHHIVKSLCVDVTNDIVSFVLDVIEERNLHSAIGRTSPALIPPSRYKVLKHNFITVSRSTIAASSLPKADVESLAEAQCLSLLHMGNNRLNSDLKGIREISDLQPKNPLPELLSMFEDTERNISNIVGSDLSTSIPRLGVPEIDFIRSQHLILSIVCEHQPSIWSELLADIRRLSPSAIEVIELSKVADFALKLFNEEGLIKSWLDSSNTARSIAESMLIESVMEEISTSDNQLSTIDKQEISSALEDLSTLGLRLQSIVENVAPEGRPQHDDARQHMTDALVAGLFGRFLKIRSTVCQALAGATSKYPSALLVGFPCNTSQHMLFQLANTNARSLESLMEEIAGMKEDSQGQVVPPEVVRAIKDDRKRALELPAPMKLGKKAKPKKKPEKGSSKDPSLITDWDASPLGGIICVRSTLVEPVVLNATDPLKSLYLSHCLNQSSELTREHISWCNRNCWVLEMSGGGEILDGQEQMNELENACMALETAQAGILAFHSLKAKQIELVDSSNEAISLSVGDSVRTMRNQLRSVMKPGELLSLFHISQIHPLDINLLTEVKTRLASTQTSQQFAIAEFVGGFVPQIRILRAVSSEYPKRFNNILSQGDDCQESLAVECRKILEDISMSEEHILFDIDKLNVIGGDHIDERHRRWLRDTADLVNEIEQYTSVTAQIIVDLNRKSLELLISAYENMLPALAASATLLLNAGYSKNPIKPTTSCRRKIRKAITATRNGLQRYNVSIPQQQDMFARFLEFPARIPPRTDTTYPEKGHFMAQETELLQLHLLQCVDTTCLHCEDMISQVRRYTQEFNDWASSMIKARVKSDHAEWSSLIAHLRNKVTQPDLGTPLPTRFFENERDLPVATFENVSGAQPNALRNVALALKSTAKGKTNVRMRVCLDAILAVTNEQGTLFPPSWRDMDQLQQLLQKLETPAGISWRAFVTQSILKSTWCLPSVQYLVELCEGFRNHSSTRTGPDFTMYMPTVNFLEYMRPRLWWMSPNWVDNTNLSQKFLVERYARIGTRDSNSAIGPDVFLRLCGATDTFSTLECLAHTFSDQNKEVHLNDLLIHLCFCTSGYEDPMLTKFVNCSCQSNEPLFDVGLYKAWCVVSRMGDAPSNPMDACTAPWVVDPFHGYVGPTLDLDQIECFFNHINQPRSVATSLWEAVASSPKKNGRVAFSDLLQSAQGKALLSRRPFHFDL